MTQDHAGHIFGVDSSPMIEKLEQYNLVLEVCLFNLQTERPVLTTYKFDSASMNSWSMFTYCWRTSSSCDKFLGVLN